MPCKWNHTICNLLYWASFPQCNGCKTHPCHCTDQVKPSVTSCCAEAPVLSVRGHCLVSSWSDSECRCCVDICVQVFIWIFTPISFESISVISEPHGGCMFDFIKRLGSFFWIHFAIPIPTGRRWDSSCCPLALARGVINFFFCFFLAISNRCIVVSHCAFNSCFPNDWGLKQRFLVLFAIHAFVMQDLFKPLLVF